jgi:hypothetical protein
MTVFDVEQLSTHGGSLRLYAQRSDTGKRPVDGRVASVIADEQAAQMTTAAFYAGFQAKADRVKDDFLSFLISAKQAGKVVAAYGAAAKGNTLLNYAGVRSDLIRFVVDQNPAKQNKYLPGSRIPIVSEARLKALKPDYIVVLPWNLIAEVTAHLSYARDWNCEYVIAVPTLVVAPLT